MLSDDKNIKFCIVKFEKYLLIQVIDARIFKPYFFKLDHCMKYVEYSKSSSSIFDYTYVCIGDSKNVCRIPYSTNADRDKACDDFLKLFKSISDRN